MDKQRLAIIAVVMGLGAGWAANLMFYERMIGLSFPLFVGLALILLFAFARIAGEPSQRRNLWVIIPLVFFAVMVAVRADLLITSLNIMAALWLGLTLLYYRQNEQALDETSLPTQAKVVINTGLDILVEPTGQVSEVWSWLCSRQLLNTKLLKSIFRGLLITLPIILVFGGLLASADAMFDDYLGQLFSNFSLDGLQEALPRWVFMLGVAWLSCGALAYSVLRQRIQAAKAAKIAARAAETRIPDDAAEDATHAAELDDRQPSQKRPAPAPSKPFSLSMIESGIVMTSVNLLFGAFVIIQFTYFFGGQDNITLEGGWTYAQYARRGFFELVAVSCMTLGLILWLNAVTNRPSRLHHIIFRALSVGVVVLTGVMLLSASGRMTLYEQVYGLTHLRVYTHTFMAWLAALYVVFLASLFLPARRIFGIGTTLCVIGYLVTLNLMNVDYAIAQQNIERYKAGYELDTAYLYTLSEDAVPALLTFALESEEGIQGDLRNWLLNLGEKLNKTDGSIFSAHLARDQACQMIKDHWGEIWPKY